MLYTPQLKIRSFKGLVLISAFSVIAWGGLITSVGGLSHSCPKSTGLGSAQAEYEPPASR